MGFKGAERAAGHTYIRKSGIAEFPSWKGLRLDNDPASLNLNELRVAENVRMLDDEVICRGGQAVIQGVGAFTGVPSGIWQPDPELPEGVTDRIFFFDLLEPNGFQPSIIRYEVGTGAFSYAQYSTVVADNTAVLGLNLFFILPEAGSSPMHRALKATGVRTGSVPVTVFDIEYIDDADRGPFLAGVANGKLWIVYGYDEVATPSNGRIYSYDGFVFQQEHAFSFAQTGSGLFIRQGGFCPFDGGWLWAPKIGSFPGLMLMVRDQFGALSFRRFDLTSDPDLDPSQMSLSALEVWSEFNRAVYLGGSGQSSTLGSTSPVIWKYEGTTPVIAHRILARGECGSCISFEGALYYVWVSRDVDGNPIQTNIGRYDGTTWDDEFGVVAGSIGSGQLVPLNRNVYFFNFDAGGVFKSAGTDLTVWSSVFSVGFEDGYASVYSRYG